MRTAQIATVLRTVGVPAYYLVGGYQTWTAKMQNAAGEGSPGEQAKKQAVACWFEGDYIAEAGLVVKTDSATGGYAPPLEPAKAAPEEDSLGLGLGLGLGPEDVKESESSSGGGKLKIGEGC